jgi:hypothetical protein
VVGFAIFHIFYLKKRGKKALLHGMWMLVGIRWNRLAMVWERKKRWGGVPSFIKEHKSVNLSQKLASFLYGR